MVNKKVKCTKLYMLLIVLSLSGMMVQESMAQGDASDFMLSRSKVALAFNSIFNMRGTMGFGGCQYPAYLGEGSNIIYSYYTGLVMYCKTTNAAGNADTTYSNVNISLKPNSLDIIDDGQVIKNYNFFSEGSDQPEEFYTGKSRWREVGLDIETKAMTWGIPKYDDFALIKMTITNNGSKEIKDLRFGPNISFDRNDQDQKFLWNEERKCYVFYDDQKFNWQDETPTKYRYGVGLLTGDAGNPADITVPDAIRTNLQDPNVYAVVPFVYPAVDKNGQDALHYFIGETSDASDTPREEISPNISHTTQEILDILTRDQARLSWDEAHADPSIIDGNKYERRYSMLTMHWGPYDLAVGESMEFVYGFVFGRMDEERIVAGGYENTKKIFIDNSYTFPGSTLDSLWTYAKIGTDSLFKNCDAAKELINNNYHPMRFSPPAVGEKGDNLSVITDKPGQIQIAFDPIPDFQDPVSGINDLAGYRVYKSQWSYIGPWTRIADIDVNELNEYMSGGQIMVTDTDFKAGTVGGGVFYTVTSYDTEGLECTPLSYNQDAAFPITAPGAPDGSQTYVVPNPFRIISGLPGTQDDERITFVNVPSHCVIRIYTVAGDMVQELEHIDGSGIQSWGSNAESDYQLTRYFKSVMPGIYIYHIESKVSGHEGESFVGKLAIVK